MPAPLVSTSTPPPPPLDRGKITPRDSEKAPEVPEKTNPSEPPPQPRQVPVVQPADWDPVLRHVLKEELDKYQENGYKQYKFGSSYESINQLSPLNWVASHESPYLFLNSEKGDETFVFNERKELVQFCKRDDGGPDDYRKPLIELFGKTNQKIEGEVVRYHFPKVLVRVYFSELTTYVCLVNKAWATGILNENIKNKRRNIEWLKKPPALSGRENSQGQLSQSFQER